MSAPWLKASTTIQNAPYGPAPETFALRRLNGERLSEAHLPILRQMHAATAMMAALGGTLDDAETTEYLERNLAHWEEYGFGIWILRDAAAGHVVGRAGLRYLGLEHASEVELSFAMLPDFWGRGLATDAARACATIGREWLGLGSIVALTLPDDLAAQRVLAKSAFAHEGEVTHAGRPYLLYRTD